MAQYQIAQRRGDRHIAAQVAGVDPRQANYFSVQQAGQDGIHAILKMLGGGMEDSATMEIVDPATGHFFKQPAISEPGGTDVDRT